MAQSNKKVQVCLAGNSDKGAWLQRRGLLVRGGRGGGVAKRWPQLIPIKVQQKYISQPLHFMHNDETALACFLNWS